MAVRPYSDLGHDRSADRSGGGAGAMIFLWSAWAIAAAFWAAVLTTGVGILRSTGGASASADVGFSGGAWALMNMVGATILGLALAYGALRYFTRDKRMDPVTEAATRQEYDILEANGGDDEVIRAPTRAGLSTDPQRPL